jgi:hydrogenase-4 component B
VGGVALLSFVKLFGSAFLGAPRSAEAAAGHESPPAMLVPMAVLALFCLAGGLFPQAGLALVTPVLASVFPAAKAYGGLSFNPLWLTCFGVALLVLAALLFLTVGRRARSVAEGHGPTWGCGYLKPAPRMQYTASSFGLFFGSLAAPLIRTRIKVAALAGLAPAPVRLSYQPEETILSRIIVPVVEVAGIGFSWLRRLQYGQMQFYIIYIFATLLLLMLWVR